MKLREVCIKNFRSYEHEVRVPIGALTTFVGRNDIGKSTVLEALEIFFNNETVKLDSGDPCTGSGSKIVEIGCVFEDFPEEIVIDSAAKTNLRDEFLLNADGFLEIKKIFNCGGAKPKEEVVIHANHPTVSDADELHSLKINDLKKLAEKLKIDKATVDFSIKASLRRAIWKATGSLNLKPKNVDLKGEDTSLIWDSLQASLPTFALFKADRASRDDDSEVQDPMKLAIKEALKSLEPQLAEIKASVQKQVTQVAARTVEKLKEMDPALAGQLTPNFKAEPKWDGIFNMSLTGDEQIPINKRGSGVRRLILLNFFRAEAERKQMQRSASSIIYAIEEPETSQHPSNQRLLAGALLELANRDNCQVIVTTHVPGFAGLLPVETLRHIRSKGQTPRIVVPKDADVDHIASELGVFPDHRVKVLVFVEGKNDVTFLQHASKKAAEHDNKFPNLFNDQRVAFVPVGGSNLKEWVEKSFLSAFKRPELHFYDRDDFDNPKYQAQCDAVNARGAGHFAALTTRREIENYIPKAAIERHLEITLPAYDAAKDDVPMLVAKAVHEKASNVAWGDVSDDKKKKKISNAKYRLNNEVIAGLTFDELSAEDTDGEILGWMQKIADHLQAPQ